MVGSRSFFIRKNESFFSKGFLFPPETSGRAKKTRNPIELRVLDINFLDDYNPKAVLTWSTKSNFSQVNNSTVTVFSFPPGAEKVLVTVSGVRPMCP